MLMAKINNVRKRRIAFWLALTILMTFAFSNWNGSMDVKAGPADSFIKFEQYEGSATDPISDGSDPGNPIWIFNYNAQDGIGNTITFNESHKPGIYANDHSAEGENIIRLIQGVKEGNVSGKEAADSYNVYRSGSAMLNKSISLQESNMFSAKFTISMPDAVVNDAQTSGYSREYGGDGIAFVITTGDSIVGQSGGGMGYAGVNNSVIIELDSYFNGSYAMLAADANGYVNWGFDNQVYSKGESSGPYYTMGMGLFVNDPATGNVILPDDKRTLIESTLDSNTVYNTWGYQQLPCVSERRFDHIGVMLNGDQKKHKALYYINNVDPTHISNDYKYDNINNPDTTDLTHTSGRFADAGVDDRLFTFWVDYDGTTMKIYYTLGKYDEAVKPETPVISYDVDLTSVLGTNNDIRVGFTSAVGSSKANHTVHGFSFANYVESDYTVEHYKWNRNTNKYEIVSADTEVLTDRVGKEVTATSKTYVNYRYNPSASLDGAEPKDTGIITEDGNLKLRFYYDPIETTYTVKKFYQQADGSFLEDTAERRNGNGYVGDSIEATTADMTPGVDKALYEFDDSVTGTIKDKVLVEDESQNELKLYFVKENTEYRTEYYLQQTDGTYNLAPGQTSNWTVGAIGTSASATIKTFAGYTKVTVNNGVDVSRENITALAFDRDDNVMKVYYNLNTSYKVEYYYQKNDGSFGTTPDSVSADRAEVAGNTAAVTEADKTPTKSGYAFDNGNTNNVLTTIVKPDGTTVLKVYFVKEDTRYKTEYYLQQADGSYVKDSSSEWTDAKVGDSVVAADKTFTGYTKVNVNNGSDKTVDSIASLVKDENSNVMKLYYNKNTTYKVEYYYEKEDGSFEKKSESTPRDCVAGKVVSVTTDDQTPEIDGYMYDADNKQLLIEDVVNADGTTTLRVYFVYETPEEPTTPEDNPLVNTGDNFNGFALILLILSGTVGIIIVVKKKKTEEV